MKRYGIRKQFFLISLITAILLTQGLPPGMGTVQAEEGAEAVNLASNKPTEHSSAGGGNNSANAVDGNPATYWQALSSDRDDQIVWLSVDLLEAEQINLVSFTVNRTDMLESYTILGSNDNQTWGAIATNNSFTQANAQATLQETFVSPFSARYIKIEFYYLTGRNNALQVSEIGIYAAESGENPEQDPESEQDPELEQDPEPNPVPMVNHALNKVATASSGTASNAVDDNPSTVWSPSQADRNYFNIWLAIDLAQPVTFNNISWLFNRADTFDSYELLISDDNVEWTQIVTRSSGFTTGVTEILDAPVTARYIKLDISMNRALSTQVNNFSVIYDPFVVDPVPDDLVSIYFVDEDGNPLPDSTATEMLIDETKQLRLEGLSSSGAKINMTTIKKAFTSSAGAASVSSDGTITPIRTGGARIYVTVDKSDGTTLQSGDYWVIVQDPSEFFAEQYVALSELEHPTMTTEIGHPAVIRPGQNQEYPSLSVRSNVEATIVVTVLRNGVEIEQLEPVSFAKDESKQIAIPGTVEQTGHYEIQLQIEHGQGNLSYDAFFFTALGENDVPANQSQIAFIGTDGKMVYVPDYKGNRILDFSNVGYMGGGVAIPDVAIVKEVYPVEGDNTDALQAAINEVANLPADENGFRGAILLKKGKYDIAGQLTINVGGIVLRGEGDGPDGTILYGTGTVQRNLITIGNGGGMVDVSGTSVPISDLYVPSGSKTFHVTNADGYEVGDTVRVRRVGNQRWLTEIGMDNIFIRPNAPDSATSQWTPFNLDFDRTITEIEGNRITVDAPLAESIDIRWGGGTLTKVTDPQRIEQVGLENLMVDTDFDRSVLNNRADDGVVVDDYYADENHVSKFAVFNGVKNSWVRNVSAYHLSIAFVEVGASSKYITVQDSNVYDMVSDIRGSRRYAVYFRSQLNLAQRIFVEDARHAFVWDSRVSGPNVFLDSVSVNDYNTSEPHHKWSVGGLFDNVNSSISIRDRAWLGSGHGWSGANYVAWNTVGTMTAQKPPTAQNYIIGHVGPKLPGLVPNNYDTRPREDAYWDMHGQAVTPVSLYKQQLMERLGPEALDNIQGNRPLIELLGDSEVYISAFTTYVDPGATAADSNGNDLTSAITVTGEVNTAEPGRYELIYNVKDASNWQAVPVTRVVHVQAANTGPLTPFIPITPETPSVITDGEWIVTAQDSGTSINVSFSGSELQELLEAEPDIKLLFKSDLGNYALPLRILDTRALADALNVLEEDITYDLQVKIAEPAVINALSERLNSIGANLKSEVVEFTLTATANGQSIAIENFGSTYVERTLSLSEENVDPGQMTAIRFDPLTQTMSFVPALFMQDEEGQWFATIKRNGNSIYAVVESNKTFSDLDGHWAQEDILLLSRKLIVEGMTSERFVADAHLTRAQLAALLVRSLGLTEKLESGLYTDVAVSDWFASAVSTASQYGLTQGYTDGSFRPNQSVSRQEAAVMLARALVFAGGSLQHEDAMDAVVFQDENYIANWAKDAVYGLAGLGLLEGQQFQRFAPAAWTTRAEAVVMLRRMLTHVGFINE